MASAVARRSVMAASRMGRASIDAPADSILELAKQDLHSQMKKAKVGYKCGFRHDNSDYSYTYNLNLQSSFSLRENNRACETRNTRGHRMSYTQSTPHQERPVSNTRAKHPARDKLKSANKISKGPAPRCHGKGLKHESLLTRGINKVKKKLFGSKVVPRRLTAKQSPVKKCLNAYGYGTRSKPWTKLDEMNVDATSRPRARDTNSKIPIPVSALSRRRHFRRFLMDSVEKTTTSMTDCGSRDMMGNNVRFFNNRRSRDSEAYDDRMYFNSPSQKATKTGLTVKNTRGRNSYRRFPDPREATSSHTKSRTKHSGALSEERSFGVETKSMSRSGQTRKQPNIRPNLSGLDPKTSRELSLIDSPMSSRGSWEGYECDNDVISQNNWPFSEHNRPRSEYFRPTSEKERPMSENVQLYSEQVRPNSKNRRPFSEDLLRPLSENLRPLSEYRPPLSKTLRPMSLELDERALSLPERRSRLEKDLDALMQSMEKVLGSPMSPCRESNSSIGAGEVSREEPEGIPGMFGRPVFEAVI